MKPMGISPQSHEHGAYVRYPDYPDPDGALDELTGRLLAPDETVEQLITQGEMVSGPTFTNPDAATVFADPSSSKYLIKNYHYGKPWENAQMQFRVMNTLARALEENDGLVRAARHPLIVRRADGESLAVMERAEGESVAHVASDAYLDGATRQSIDRYLREVAELIRQECRQAVGQRATFLYLNDIDRKGNRLTNVFVAGGAKPRYTLIDQPGDGARLSRIATLGRLSK